MSKDMSRKKGQATRIRKNIYVKRVVFSLRLHPELRQRMMNVCDELGISANVHITNLLEKDLQTRQE